MKHLSVRSQRHPSPYGFSWMQSRRWVRGLAVLLCSATLITAVPPQAEAQTFAERIQVLFTRRREAGSAAGRSRGGAIRSGCQTADLEGDRPLIALSPEGNLGRTSEDYPTFWFYSPFTKASTGLTALFTLLDEERNPVLQDLSIPVTLPDEPGLVSFRLPETEAALQPGQRYNWYFTIVCQLPTGDSQDLTEVSGWVERAELPAELNGQLQTTPAADQYQIYAGNDFWYETVAELAQNRETASVEWTSLLGLFELEDLAYQPITPLEPVSPPATP